MTEAGEESLGMEGERESLGMESPLRSPKRLKLHRHRLYPHQQADEGRLHEEEEEEEEEEKEEKEKGNVGVATADPGASVSTSLSLALPHSPQQPHTKCRLFSTPQGCPFASSCLFSYSSGEELSGPLSVSKAMLCTKFFSTSGCPYGNRCRFSHYDPKSASSVAALGAGSVGVEKFLKGLNTLNLGIVPKTMLGDYKSRICNQFGTLKGCHYGEKCHFAHGEQELRRREGDVSSDACIVKPPGAKSPNTSNLENLGNKPHVWYQASSSKTSAAAFGRSSKAMIDVDANLAGPIIGRRGIHAKQICGLTGAKLCVREHDSDLNLGVVEMEGSFEQVKQAGQLLKQVLFHALKRTPRRSRRSLKVCKNFPLGKCAFGNRCHFVHAAMAEEPSMAGT